MTDPLREKLRTLAGEIRACESQYQWIALRIATILDAEGQDETAEFGSGVCAHNVGDAGPCRCVLPRGHSGLHICECEQHAAPSVSPGEDEGVGTGAGEGAPRQDTGSAWVTRSADCPEDPAQAHPLTPEGQPEGGDDRNRGLYGKYRVERIVDPTGKHAECRYFVLDPQHDPIARQALDAYAYQAEAAYPQLARDLREWLGTLSDDYTIEGQPEGSERCVGYPRCDKAQAIRGVDTTDHDGPCRCRCGSLCSEPDPRCAWCGKYAAPAAVPDDEAVEALAKIVAATRVDATDAGMKALLYADEDGTMPLSSSDDPAMVAVARAVLAAGYVSPEAHEAAVREAVQALGERITKAVKAFNIRFDGYHEYQVKADLARIALDLTREAVGE